MGLINARNLRKAKQLLDKNRHKVGDVVGKATTKLDEVSGGKTSNISKKAEEAARKYSAGGATNHGVHIDAVSDGQNMNSGQNRYDGRSGAMSKEEMQLRQAEANAAAANAFASAANAASGFLAKAAQMQAQADGASPPPADATPESNDDPAPLDGPPPLSGD